MSSYRLPPDLRDDLEWYWCRADADLGVHSNMSATIARSNLLAHGKPKRERDEDRPSGIRLALAHSTKRPAKHAARDEALRLFCLLGNPKHDQPAHGELMPEQNERWRRKIRIVYSVLMRMKQSAHGVWHEAILFLVYGDTKQSIMADELARIAKLAKSRKMADDMLAAASRAYADAHEVEIAERKRDRRERFRAMLGAA
jgi:hypothetical protein